MELAFHSDLGLPRLRAPGWAVHTFRRRTRPGFLAIQPYPPPSRCSLPCLLPPAGACWCTRQLCERALQPAGHLCNTTAGPVRTARRQGALPPPSKAHLHVAACLDEVVPPGLRITALHVMDNTSSLGAHHLIGLYPAVTTAWYQHAPSIIFEKGRHP